MTIHGLRRTATDLLRRAAVDPVTAKAIIGHTTDRMREHYSTVGTDEARGIGARLVSLVPGCQRSRDGWLIKWSITSAPVSGGDKLNRQLIETT